MTRRELILSGTAAAVLPGCRLLSHGEDYSVSLLGDVHYDCPPIDVFHSEFRRLHTNDGMFAKYRTEFESLSSMWGADGRSASLVKASGACRLADTAFALQLGDLVEGDCESPSAHERMLAEAFALMKRAYGEDIPFVTVCGNHDIRRGGNRQGEYDLYCRIASAWHSKDLSMSVVAPTFSFRQGPDVWIVADFNRPDVALVERLLTDSSDARYVFFCTHGAVLTTGARTRRRWFYLGGPQYDAKGRALTAEFGKPHPEWDEARRRVRRLLAARKAIALTGHSHRLELRDWFGDGGRITEFVMNSTTKKVQGGDIPAVPVVVGNRSEDFGRCRNDPKTGISSQVEALYAEYEPGIRRYYTADATGHARLRISDQSVVAEFFPGSATNPVETFRLR